MNRLPLLFALSLVTAAARAATFLGGFDAAPMTVATGSGTASGSAGIGDGTARSLTTTVQSNAAPRTNRAWSSVSGGVYTLGSDAGVDAYGWIDYTFDGLDVRGITAFQIDFLANVGLTTIGLTLGDANADVALRALAVGSVAAPFSLTFEVPDYVARDLDLSRVTNLSVWIDTSLAGQVRIAAIRPIQSLQPGAPVPEPASLAALGVGALGLSRRRRKA